MKKKIKIKINGHNNTLYQLSLCEYEVSICEIREEKIVTDLQQDHPLSALGRGKGGEYNTTQPQNTCHTKQPQHYLTFITIGFSQLQSITNL